MADGMIMVLGEDRRYENRSFSMKPIGWSRPIVFGRLSFSGECPALGFPHMGYKLKQRQTWAKLCLIAPRAMPLAPTLYTGPCVVGLSISYDRN